MKKLLLILFILLSSIANAQTATFGNVEFGATQVADTQWDTDNCLSSNTCTIYSKNVGGTYETGSWTQLTSGQYISFVSSGNSSYPWQMNLYNSSGQLIRDLGIGQILVQGTYNGNYYLFFSNAQYNGTLLSAQLGMSGSAGFTFTGTESPTVAQTNTAAASWTTTPLAPGQTYTPAPTYTSNITPAEQSRYNAAEARLNALSGDSVYISQSLGNSNEIYVTQTGKAESVDGVGQQQASIQGTGNSITIHQGDPVALQGNNLIDLSVVGNNNTLNLNQGYDQNSNYSGTDQGGHYQLIEVNGNSNNVLTSQQGQGQYGEVNITGNSNQQTMIQSGQGNQLFSVINGSNNILNTTQTGNIQNFLDVSLTGNGNSAVVSQSGTTQNKATISIINDGGAGGVNLTQTGGQVYSITVTCVTAGGCGTTTVKQGN